MKQLTLHNKHTELGAKMVNYAGFLMPIQYQGINIEHQNVREHVGIFDVSHMGEFIVSNKNALDLIQKATTNDASKLNIGKAQYSCMPNKKGGIVDDLIIYKLENEKYLLVVNAANIQKDWDWLQNLNDVEANLENVSDDYCLFAVQGPKSLQTLQPLTSVDLSKIPYYHFEVGNIANFDDTIISNTGYTGSGGFEIYCKQDNAIKIWESILKSGQTFNIQPIGLAARDTLRMEMGYCLYGNDIDDTTSPLEAGLGWITKFTKDFTHYKYFKNQKEKGVTKKLVGFELTDKGIPRKNYLICNHKGNIIGKVTSGTMSPSFKKAIGMGYVDIKYSHLNDEIYIKIRDKFIKGKIVKIPFYKP